MISHSDPSKQHSGSFSALCFESKQHQQLNKEQSASSTQLESRQKSSLGCHLPHSGAAQELTPGLCLPHQILCFDPRGFDSTTNDAGACDVNPPVADKGGWWKVWHLQNSIQKPGSFS